jgi:hypothetical protein
VSKTRGLFWAHFFIFPNNPIKPIDKVGNEAYIPIHTKQVGIYQLGGKNYGTQI